MLLQGGQRRASDALPTLHNDTNTNLERMECQALGSPQEVWAKGREASVPKLSRRLSFPRLKIPD